MLISLDPKTSALVVVDMQNDFCAQAGYYARAGADISNFAAVDGPVAGMIERARRSNVPIVFTRLSPTGPSAARWRIAIGSSCARWSSTGERLKPGSWGADMIDTIAPRPEDLIVDKAGYSAFEDTALEAEAPVSRDQDHRPRRSRHLCVRARDGVFGIRPGLRRRDGDGCGRELERQSAEGSVRHRRLAAWRGGDDGRDHVRGLKPALGCNGFCAVTLSAGRRC